MESTKLVIALVNSLADLVEAVDGVGAGEPPAGLSPSSSVVPSTYFSVSSSTSDFNVFETNSAVFDAMSFLPSTPISALGLL